MPYADVVIVDFVVMVLQGTLQVAVTFVNGATFAVVLVTFVEIIVEKVHDIVGYHQAVLGFVVWVQLCMVVVGDQLGWDGRHHSLGPVYYVAFEYLTVDQLDDLGGLVVVAAAVIQWVFEVDLVPSQQQNALIRDAVGVGHVLQDWLVAAVVSAVDLLVYLMGLYAAAGQHLNEVQDLDVENDFVAEYAEVVVGWPDEVVAAVVVAVAVGVRPDLHVSATEVEPDVICESVAVTDLIDFESVDLDDLYVVGAAVVAVVPEHPANEGWVLSN